MTNTKFLLLASACLLLSGNSQASEVKNLTFGYSGSPLVKTHTTHIHTPYELKPISLFNMDKAVKLAAVRSIVDKGNYDSGLTFGSSDIDTNLDPANQCAAEGFTLSECPEHSFPDESTRCPHDKNYFSACSCDTSYYNVTDGNQDSTCGITEVYTQSCTDKSGTYHYCYCEDFIMTLCSMPNQYISEQDYRTNIVQGNNYCRDSHSLTYHYPENICQSCEYPYVVNASKTGCTCSPEFIECDFGHEAGAESCTDTNGAGYVTKYNKCKSCPNLGTYTSCPTGYTCTFEDCSNKYYITGCATGYVDLDNCSWKCKFTKIMPKN